VVVVVTVMDAERRCMDLREQMDRVYRELALEEIPWNLESPPAVLVRLVESRWVQPCDAVDLGCGAGNHAVWLATLGFRMTGVEISPKALEHAERLAVSRGVRCRWVAADVVAGLEGLENAFDFAYDWEVLHHVFPEDRERYVAGVHRTLRPRGRYVSVCFSETDASGFGGKGKYFQTRIGTTIYFSSEQELRRLFEPLFLIDDLREIEIPAKERPHAAILARLIKKDEHPVEKGTPLVV
jgi:SAM-dependent methyltransferase